MGDVNVEDGYLCYSRGREDRATRDEWLDSVGVGFEHALDL